MRGVALAAALAVAIPAGAVAQSGSVEDCVAQGGTRYETPSDATTHQYVGQDGLCAAADDDDTDVVITPVGGGKKPAASPPARPTRTAAAPASPAPAPDPPAAAPQPTPEPTPKPAKTAPEPAPRTTPDTAAEGRGAAATRSVTAALDTSEPDAGLSAAGAAGAVPGGVLGALLAALGLAGAGVGLRHLNRR